MIKEINKFRTLLVYTKLEADMFESFKFNSDKEYINIGINLSYLSKCLKFQFVFVQLANFVMAEIIKSIKFGKNKRII